MRLPCNETPLYCIVEYLDDNELVLNPEFLLSSMDLSDIMPVASTHGFVFNRLINKIQSSHYQYYCYYLLVKDVHVREPFCMIL